MSGGDWLERLYGLLARFPELGIGHDLAMLPLIDLWGVYCFLRRIEAGG